MILKPLNREYWPREVSRPIVRLAFALLGAPLAIGLLLGLFALAVFWANPNGQSATIEAWETLIAYLTAFYPLTALVATPVVLVLWSLRARSRGVWLLAGFLVGGVGAGAQAVTSGMAEIVEVMTLVFLGAALMLTIRSLAKIRR